MNVAHDLGPVAPCLGSGPDHDRVSAATPSSPASLCGLRMA